MLNVIVTMSALVWMLQSPSYGAGGESLETLRTVQWLSENVRAVKPSLSRGKAFYFAVSIFRASQRYGIDPLLLIAIARQESTFREKLSEGRAGERGICQILKRWTKVPSFRAEFGMVTISDLENASKAFYYAAWILKDLKGRYDKPSRISRVPYWAYYNSRQLRHRIRYYERVNRHFRKLASVQPRVMVPSSPFLMVPKAGWIGQTVEQLLKRDYAYRVDARRSMID